jgi:probable HAF family extracellular repeat protein
MCAVMIISLSVTMAAQASHYKLIQIGTLGGPNSNVPLDPSVEQVLSEQGTVVGCADTAVPDPSFSNPNPAIVPDPYIQHQFQWKNGVLTDLGTLGGYDSCNAVYSISGGGQIIGAAENGVTDPLTGFPEIRAVVWNNGQINDLGTLGGYESFSISVNNRGQVTGQAANTIYDPFPFPGFGQQARAFLWQNGSMQDLGTLGTGTDAFGISINDRGHILGFSYINSTPNPSTGLPTGDGFFWADGVMQDISNPLGGKIVSPYYINNHDQAVGNADLVGDIHTHPFLWSNGVFTDLGTFGGLFGSAQMVNEAGQVAGTANLAGDTTFYGFLWANGTKRMLLPVAGDDCSQTHNMNQQGVVVVGWSGQAMDSNCVANPLTTVRAVLWEKDGSVVDLNTRIPSGTGIHLLAATNINESGEIVGEGLLPNDDGRVVLLIPCDENHPGIEGCDYSPVDEHAAPSVPPLLREPLRATPYQRVWERNRRLHAPQN